MKSIAVFVLAVGPTMMTAQVGSHAMRQTAAPSVNPAPSAMGKPVARVNGAILTDRDLLREMYTIFPYARQHSGFPKTMEADIRKGALRMIEFEELVYQEARRRKMTIPAAKLDRAVADFRAQFPSNQDFQDFLKAEVNGSQQQLRSKIERSMLIEQFLKIEVADKASVTQAQLKTYYDQNPQHFQTPESFVFQTISILPPEKAVPSELLDVHKRAEDALKQAKATKSYEQFGMLAEKISQDDYHVMMGDRQTVERSKLPPEVAGVMSHLQTGQVSELISIGPAFCIVRVNGHNAAGKQSFESVKKTLRDQLEKSRTQQLRSTLDKQLRATAKVEEL